MKLLLTATITFFTMSTQAQFVSNPPAIFDPAPYGFSHVATVPAGSRLLFIAGQGGEENNEGKLSPDFHTQVQWVFRNIKTALASKNASLDDVVKVTTLVVDHDSTRLQVIIEEFRKNWPGQNFPVNTLIPVPRLALDGMLVEIDACAVVKEK